MPKKARILSPQEQQARFEHEVERMINAGELDPAEADQALDRVTKRLLISPLEIPPVTGAAKAPPKASRKTHGKSD